MLQRLLSKINPQPPDSRDIQPGPLDAAGRAAVDRLDSVCFFLGPNRNLTTLTASVLALHPNCQVLSHAGARILPVDDLNFLNEYSDEKFANFCHYALAISQGLDKGGYGGSITVTHAFRNHKGMRHAYRRRFGRALIKREVRSLVWKEAHRVDDFVEREQPDLGAIFARNPKLRALMPIRNPLHVAQSFDARAGFKRKYFGGLDDPDAIALLDSILNKMERTVRLHLAQPERVFIFFEDEVNAALLAGLATFLRLPPDDRWAQDALACFEVQEPAYETAPELVAQYRQQVQTRFADTPRFLEGFLRFVD